MQWPDHPLPDENYRHFPVSPILAVLKDKREYLYEAVLVARLKRGR